MMLKKILIFTFLIFVHLLILFKIQFIAWPEMISYAYLLKKGYLLYKDIINPYPPLLPYLMVLYYGIFGFSLLSLKLFTYLIVFLLDLTLFIIVRKIFNFKTAVLSLLFFIILQTSFEGNGIWFDLSLTPFLIIGYFISYKLVRLVNKKLFLYLVFIQGLILSISFLIKQTSIFFLISQSLLLIFISKRINKILLNLLIIIVAFITPIAFISFFLIDKDIFSDYLFWVYQYPFKHISSAGFLLLPTLRQSLLILIILIPLVFIFLKNRKELKISLVFFWLIPGFLFALPRFSYFHLQPTLPFVTILLSSIFYKTSLRKRLTFGLPYLFILLSIFGYFFSKWANKEPRFYDRTTQKNTLVLERILKNKGHVYFYNVSSEYFVISGLLPSKPWADTFPWYLETPDLQERIIQSMERENLEFVVFREFNNEGRYVPGSYRPLLIDEYIQTQFVPFEELSDNLTILRRKNTSKQL